MCFSLSSTQSQSGPFTHMLTWLVDLTINQVKAGKWFLSGIDKAEFVKPLLSCRLGVSELKEFPSSILFFSKLSQNLYYLISSVKVWKREICSWQPQTINTLSTRSMLFRIGNQMLENTKLANDTLGPTLFTEIGLAPVFMFDNFFFIKLGLN